MQGFHPFLATVFDPPARLPSFFAAEFASPPLPPPFPDRAPPPPHALPLSPPPFPHPRPPSPPPRPPPPSSSGSPPPCLPSPHSFPFWSRFQFPTLPSCPALACFFHCLLPGALLLACFFVLSCSFSFPFSSLPACPPRAGSTAFSSYVSFACFGFPASSLKLRRFAVLLPLPPPGPAPLPFLPMFSFACFGFPASSLKLRGCHVARHALDERLVTHGQLACAILARHQLRILNVHQLRRPETASAPDARRSRGLLPDPLRKGMANALTAFRPARAARSRPPCRCRLSN